ncbi:hypothetical protein SAMN04487948_10479 [Halogranum amylolyticum]|uniref:Uncharacterized protein n=1 Tax=Halogranum amylolyticum TaxID=660520 RepID=A0A1H8RKN1_9EURY|nr:hypothetical protein [Halogranum amylolyticum]SEO66892.1 hypothetical protein SAMN04487948_10479 [Halogranum amylolyticum]
MASTDIFDDISRRQLLAALGTAGAVGGGVVATQSPLGDGPDPIETTVADDETARRLAERHAPTLYFGTREKWFPTDPREFTSDHDGKRVLDGFDALDSYTKRYKRAGEPPAPAACYRVVEYPDTSLAVVQYWFYSVFDQFTTNFHWHDWEVLHVFVDTDRDEPMLYVASAHATTVPNNEFLDPETIRPSVISEVGSHSSALGVNERRESFQRVGLDGLVADITNGPLNLADLGELPVAYGLPRDEGFRLPFVVPELDDEPVTEHERLPNVTLDDLLPDDVTVRSFADLTRPPSDLPLRETGHVFVPAGIELTDGPTADADQEYDLVPIDEVREIDALTGPQLSFEFAVPTVVEDAVSSHLAAPNLPWEQPRFTDPSLDVTDPSHRDALRNRYGIDHPATGDRLVGAVRQAVPAEDAPDGAGITTEQSQTEAVCLLESDPVAAPTWNGVVAFRDVPEGTHRLTVNGAGLAPYAEELTVEGDGELNSIGVDGAVTVVANEDAVRVHADADGELTNVRVTDDVGGRVYDATPPGKNSFAVNVHRGGSYTAEVTDSGGKKGAYRVNPKDGDTSVGLGTVRTGKASLAEFLVDLLEETRASVRADVSGETTPGNAEQNRPDESPDANASASAANGTNTTTGASVANTTDTANATTATDATNTTTATDATNATNTTTTTGTTDTNTTETTNVSSATNTTNTTNATVDNTSVSVDGNATTNTTLGETEDSVETATDESRNDTDAVGTDVANGTGAETNETSDTVSESTEQVGGSVGSLLETLDRAVATAEAARDAAEDGDAESANESLRTLQTRLDAVEGALNGDITGRTRGLVERRLQVARERTNRALETPV